MLFCITVSPAQTLNLKFQGNFSREDSMHIVMAYSLAKKSVDQMHAAMCIIRDAPKQDGNSRMASRAEQWRKNETFIKWLGDPSHLRRVTRNIHKIHRKFNRKFILEVVKEDNGRCNRFVGAWAVPYGRVKIRLCRNFLNSREEISAKFLVHEVGHEAGMLFHQKLFSCRDVLRAAAERDDEAKKSPETYAWLAMSYAGVDCFSGGRY